MTSFVRLFGGALGALIADRPRRRRRHPAARPVDARRASSCWSRWIGAWFVIGFSILPYITVLPARWLIRRVIDLSTGEFVSAVGGPDRRPADRPAARPADGQPARPVQLAAADRHGHRHRPGHDGPDRRQAARPGRGAALGRHPEAARAADRRSTPGAGPSPTSTPAPSSTAESPTSSPRASCAGTLVVPRFVVAELQQHRRPAATRPAACAAGAASRCSPCSRRTRASRSS